MSLNMAFEHLGHCKKSCMYLCIWHHHDIKK